MGFIYEIKNTDNYLTTDSFFINVIEAQLRLRNLITQKVESRL